MADVNITLIDFGEKAFSFRGQSFPRYCIFKSPVPALFSYWAESVITIDNEGTARWLKHKKSDGVSHYIRKPLTKKENKELTFQILRSERCERLAIA